MAVVACALALAGARPAAAQPETMALTWHAPRGCPGEARVVAEVMQNLAGAGTGAPPFAAVVGVRRTANARWEASLLFQSHDLRAERRFDAESCDAIASAAALVIALWAEGGIDARAPAAAVLAPEPPLPAVTPAPFEPSASPEAHRSATLTETITASSPPASAAPVVDPERARWVLMMNWLVDRDTMPEAPALGIEVAGGRRWAGQHWRLRALGAVSYFPSQHTSFNAAAFSPGDLQLLDVSSRGCLTFAAGQFEIGPCAGGELAVMHGSVESGDLVNATQVWLSLLGGAAISWRVYPAVAIFARGEVVVPTTQRTFIAREGLIPRDNQAVGPAYTIPAVAGRGALGIEMRFQ